MSEVPRADSQVQIPPLPSPHKNRGPAAKHSPSPGAPNLISLDPGAISPEAQRALSVANQWLGTYNRTANPEHLRLALTMFEVAKERLG